MRKARKCCKFSYRENERHRTSAWVRRETARRRRDIPRRPRRRDRFHAGTHTSQSGGRVASGRLERGSWGALGGLEVGLASANSNGAGARDSPELPRTKLSPGAGIRIVIWAVRGQQAVVTARVDPRRRGARARSFIHLRSQEFAAQAQGPCVRAAGLGGGRCWCWARGAGAAGWRACTGPLAGVACLRMCICSSTHM